VQGLSDSISGGQFSGFVVEKVGTKWIDIVVAINNLVIRTTGISITHQLVWTSLYFFMILPIVVAYYALSRMLSIRLDIAAVSVRLSRIVVVVFIIIVLNYVSIWLEQ
jgi:hypothetical protein